MPLITDIEDQTSGHRRRLAEQHRTLAKRGDCLHLRYMDEAAPFWDSTTVPSRRPFDLPPSCVVAYRAAKVLKPAFFMRSIGRRLPAFRQGDGLEVRTQPPGAGAVEEK
jgi:hypothetical protein